MSSIPLISTGLICATGKSAAAAFDTILSGRETLQPLTLFDHRLKQPPLCGQITDDINQLNDFYAPNRTTALAAFACLQALTNIQPAKKLKFGLIVGTTIGGITESERFYERQRTDESVLTRASAVLAHHEPVALTGFLAQLIKEKCSISVSGFHTLSTACSSSLHCIGLAKRAIERNVFDLCLAVGADALSLLTIRGFSSLLLIDPTGCKPFDARRAGISMGEGAAAMLLGTPSVVKDLGLKPLAHVAGWGASADAHHMTAPHPQGAGAVAAIASALRDAALPALAISAVATHGTATPDNDAAEINALKSALGTLPPFFSVKRSTGHTLAASGIIESILAIQALASGTIPPTKGFEQIDPAIGAAPAPHGQQELSAILKTSFGFGGNNAAMVFTK